MGLLETAIGDPLCATCQSEVWPSALEKKCAECGELFDIGRSNDVSLLDLKIEVYGKARAKERQEAKGATRRFMWRRRHD